MARQTPAAQNACDVHVPRENTTSVIGWRTTCLFSLFFPLGIYRSCVLCSVGNCWAIMCMSCDIHTHTPARKSYTNVLLYYLLIQTISGMGMGMNVTAQCTCLGACWAAAPPWPPWPPCSGGSGALRRRGSEETTPNLPTNITPANIARVKLSQRSPMDMRIPPL